MNTIKIKIPAKINLTLDVIGKDNGFHSIRSLVAPINIYDVVILKKRKDNQIKLKVDGIDCECEEKDNNAYKACKLFMDRFNTLGVDIVVKKKIPLASGLGGSSADIAGVLIGMKKLFDLSVDIDALANELSSDGAYMIHGGYAVIRGKGEEIVPVKSKIKIPAIIITDEVTISSKEGYEGFDNMDIKNDPTTYEAVSALIDKKPVFFTYCKNDLQPYAESVLPVLSKKQKELLKYGAKCAVMSGSGTAMYGLFMNYIDRDKAYRKLSKHFKGQVKKCHTFNI